MFTQTEVRNAQEMADQLAKAARDEAHNALPGSKIETLNLEMQIGAWNLIYYLLKKVAYTPLGQVEEDDN